MAAQMKKTKAAGQKAKKEREKRAAINEELKKEKKLRVGAEKKVCAQAVICISICSFADDTS